MDMSQNGLKGGRRTPSKGALLCTASTVADSL